MPIINCKRTKQTKNQLRYNRQRARKRERLYKKIQEDYIKMAMKNLSKGFIISELQEKYKDSYNGKQCSSVTIYNALNFREIDKRIRATQGCDPLLGAKAG